MSNFKNKKLLNTKSRSKRSLEKETKSGNYNYWLSQKDIAHIASIVYHNYKAKNLSGSEFEIVGSIAHLEAQIIRCESKYEKMTEQRLTTIINQNNLHWITLVFYFHPGGRLAYYVDSMGNPLPDNYYELLQKHDITLAELPLVIQQTDEHNCGLWALENAKDLNDMLDDESKSLVWLVEQLKRSRAENYFITRRQVLAASLSSDSERNNPQANKQHVSINRFEITEEAQVNRNEPRKRLQIADVQESKVKRLKFSQEKNKLIAQSETFVEAFINEVAKRVAAAHVVARVQSLTIEGLVAELKSSAMASLFGVTIVQGVAGSVPAIVTFVKTMGNQLVIPKSKARIITRAFSNVSKEGLSQLLAEAALELFKSFEAQFIQVTDKAGDTIAMEKLAEDASSRLMNYIAKNWKDEPITQEIITKGVLIGESQKYFSPNVKKLRLRVTAHFVRDMEGNSINTANLYQKTGIIVSKKNQVSQFFVKVPSKPDSTQYGYRQLFSWEKNEEGELKSDEQKKYQQETIVQKKTAFQRYANDYSYYLKDIDIQEEASNFLKKINNKYPDLPAKKILKKSILFDLRKPVASFTGREMTLNELHNILTSTRAATIVSSLASLSFEPISPQAEVSVTHPQASLSGLGGIGKTQLALRYAELYAVAYDHNVIWIDSETKLELKNSFHKLASKLGLDIKNKYGAEKNIENIIEEVYEYFSDRKSLFIFDNVENYQTIASFLPKTIVGNSPSLLITSRYINWKNVANVINLGVFTEAETLELVKKGLNLTDNTQDEAIKELNRLVQGLPLALQQAIAYISSRKMLGKFEVKDYNELFRSKDSAVQLLNFEFWNYSNDPYIKTVYTTWSITLDKIFAEDTTGITIQLLQMMAYMSSDGVNSYIFFPLYLPDELISAFSILKSYSLIDIGKYEGQFVMHRLLQKVIAIHLERNQTKFFAVADKIERLLREHRSNNEIRNQYLHFILYADSFHLKLSHFSLPSIEFRPPAFKKFFMLIAEMSQDEFLYFFDIARMEFEKNKYIDFLAEGLFFFHNTASANSVSRLIDYFYKLMENGFFSVEEISQILEKRDTLGEYFGFKAPRSVRRPEKKMALLSIFSQLTLLKYNLFEKAALLNCDSTTRKKRSTLCLLAEEKESVQNQAKYKYLQTINRIAKLTSTGLLTKDIFSDLLQGNFDAVAANFKLLFGSVVLGKLSNKLLVTGTILTADERLLLNKALSLENKIALSILFNENVISPVKRKFFGKAMKVASPFVKRGTSIIFAYDFINEVKEYRKGNHIVLPSLISTGIIVGVDGIQAGIEGAEFLGWMSGVSAFAGPLGEGITALVWLTAESYQVKKTVEDIEKYVHLTSTQAFIEGMRAFFGFAPSDYIQTKANNNEMVQKAIDFLKQHPEFKRYLFPAFVSSQEVHLVRRVYLNKKFNITLSEIMPDDPKEGNLICLSGIPDKDLDSTVLLSSLLSLEGHVDKTDIYLCEKVMGLEYAVNRTGEATLIALGPGDNEVVVSSNSSTLAIIESGRKHYKIDNVLFILQGNNITGTLKGGKGINHVIVNDFYPSANAFILLNSAGFLCEKKDEGVIDNQLSCDTDKGALQLDNIQHIYGRKNKKDIFYLNGNVRFVDNYGGKTASNPDYIYVEKSHKELQIVLRSHSMVLFSPNANFTFCNYRIPGDQVGKSGVQFAFLRAGQHRFFFEAGLEDIDTIVIGNHSISFNVFSSQSISLQQGKNLFSVIISDADYLRSQDNNQTNVDIQFPKQAYYFLSDGTEIKFLEKGNLYAKQQTNKSIATILEDYPAIAHRLKMELSIECINSQNETQLVLIGNGNHEILYNDPQVTSHLVGNGGENIYVITSTPNITDSFSISEVILYNKRNSTAEFFHDWIDTLDLRPLLVESVKKISSKQRIIPSVIQSGTDLIIKLDTLYSRSGNHAWNIATIRLHSAFTENWYQQLDILLKTQHPMSIVNTDDNTWELMLSPLVFDNDKDIIVIRNEDITKESEVIVLKNIGNYTFLRRNKTDLIITNLMDTNTTSSFNFCSILFSQFYELDEMKETVLSLTLLFFDQELILKQHEDQINNATEFYSLFEQYRNKTKQISFNGTVEKILQPSNLSSYSDATRRTKRQVEEAYTNNNASLFIDEYEEYHYLEERYLEKYETNKKVRSRSRRFRNAGTKQRKETIRFSDQTNSKQLEVVKNESISHLNKKKMIPDKNRYNVFPKVKNLSPISAQESFPLVKRSRSRAIFFHPNTTFITPKSFIGQCPFLGNTGKKLLNSEKNQKTRLYNHSVLLKSSQKENNQGAQRSTYEGGASFNVNNTLFFTHFLIQKLNKKKSQKDVVKQKVLRNVIKIEKQQETRISRIGGLRL